MNTPTKTKKPSILPLLIIALIAILGLAFLLYPSVAELLNSLDNRSRIDDYNAEVQTIDNAAYEDALKRAHDYNDALSTRADYIQSLDDAQRAEYESILNVTGTGIMGYIEVPKAGIFLPIYHGTDENVLHSGIGHVEGSSLPVGGIGTHTVLSGHTGLPSAKLFSNIDRLVVGDDFQIHVLNEVLYYRVESVTIVLPEEVESLKIEPNEEICTLMTCTPYGVNTHRLLVRGVRVDAPPENAEERVSLLRAVIRDNLPVLAICAGVLILACVMIVVLGLGRKKNRKLSVNNKQSNDNKDENKQEK